MSVSASGEAAGWRHDASWWPRLWMNRLRCSCRFMDCDAGSLLDQLERGLVLVHDVELDRARRLVGQVLITVHAAARDVDAVAGLEGARCLALDGQGDFAFLHRRPLVARMAVELVAGARRYGDGLQPHHARSVVLQRRRVIDLYIRIGRRRLRPCGGGYDSGCHDDGGNNQLVHEVLPWVCNRVCYRYFRQVGIPVSDETTPIAGMRRSSFLVGTGAGSG